jgi:hypothetical protein
MTLDPCTLLLGELLAMQARDALSAMVTGDMVRLPSPMPGGGMEWRPPRVMGRLCVALCSVTQENVGGGNPVAKQGMVMLEPSRARMSG